MGRQFALQVRFRLQMMNSTSHLKFPNPPARLKLYCLNLFFDLDHVTNLILN